MTPARTSWLRWPWLAAMLLLTAGSALAGRLSPGLELQLAETPEEADLRVLVALEERVDIAALDLELHRQRATRAHRHAEVMLQLQETAARTQGPLLETLDALKAAGKVRGYTAHWLLNGVVVVAPARFVPELALLPGVEVVEADLVPALIEPLPSEGPAQREERDIGITPGLTLIEADRVWYELGITGEGALVANMDTGVHLAHEALFDRWRGHFAPADECWWDAWGGSTNPNDSNGHGSHVMGTITGLAEGDSIGVAPGALWIATNVIASGTGNAFDNAVIAGLEWLSDPDDDPFTIVDVPDVVQHSWGVNENFAGYMDCDSRWWNALDACEALGVVNTWSAGNEGPGPGTLRSPADRATSPSNSFSVGSCTTNNANPQISSFSSRGPSGCAGSLYPVKPEVTAPGSDIYSVQSGTTGGYMYLSGTSMAGPHVAGVVGLMRSANPDLDVITIKEILMETAIDRGSAGDDNTWGMGLINAYEAVLAAMSGYGAVAGVVESAGDGSTLAGVLIENLLGGQMTLSGEDGSYNMLLPAGETTLRYSLFGFETQEVAYTIVAEEILDGSLAIQPVPYATVSGVVRDGAGLPIAGAVVQALGTPLPPAVSAADGSYSLELPLGAGYLLRSGLPLETAHPLGPDNHGYRAYDPDDRAWAEVEVELQAGGLVHDFVGPALPAWDWMLIDPLEGGPGTVLDVSGGDDVTVTQPLPFVFRYYGVDYSEFSICGNGWIAMGQTTSVDWSNSLIPDPEDGPMAMIAPFWEDLSPQQAGSGSISMWHDEAGGRLIVEFHNIRQWSPATAFETFQVELRDPALHPTATGDGLIIFRYGDLSDLESMTAGIESPDGSDGLMIFHSHEDTGIDVIDGCPQPAQGMQFVFSTGFVAQQVVLQPVDDLRVERGAGNQAHLDWSPAPGAQRYRVERAAGLGEPWTELGTTTGTSWTDAYASGVRIYRVIAEADEQD
jgi:subtilisin family serine protease